MTEEPVDRQNSDSNQSTPLPTSEEIAEALGKVANGQVPERRVAERRKLADRRQSGQEVVPEDDESEANPT